MTTLKLWHNVIIGLTLGAIVGKVLGESACHLKPIGDIFIRLVKMIIVPLILCAIINGVTSMGSGRQIGRIGLKATGAYLLTTLCAIFIGFLSAYIFAPGVGLDLRTASITPVSELSTLDTILHPLINLIPDNAFGAMAQGNILQVVFFALFTAFTIHSMGEQGRIFSQFFSSLSKLIFKMIALIVELSPYAAFALTACVVGTQGEKVLYNLGKLIISAFFAFLIQYGVFGILIRIFGRLSPWPFYKKSVEYQAISFSTSSTKASLPTTMSVCREKMGISKLCASFVLPLGATINMDGLAIYLGLCAVFVAQATGVVLSYQDYGLIIIMATLGSIGGAGIPSAALITLPIVLQSVNLPIEGVALIAGIDRIMDMMRSTISITGDAAVTLIIDSSEKQLDTEQYYKKT